MELRTWKLQMLSLTCESDELITPIRTFRSSLRLRGGLSVSGTIGKSGTICILVFLVSGFLVGHGVGILHWTTGLRRDG